MKALPVSLASGGRSRPASIPQWYTRGISGQATSSTPGERPIASRLIARAVATSFPTSSGGTSAASGPTGTWAGSRAP